MRSQAALDASPRPWRLSDDREKGFTICDANGVEILKTRPRKMGTDDLKRAKADLQLVLQRVNR